MVDKHHLMRLKMGKLLNNYFPWRPNNPALMWLSNESIPKEEPGHTSW